MSSLTFVPNVAVMAAQTGIFSQLLCCEEVAFEPYLKVYDKDVLDSG